jgi:hypothetical protein
METVHSMIRLLGLCWFLGTVIAGQSAQLTFNGRSVFLNGQPFLMKGVCYAPNPIGHSGEQAPNGDFFTTSWRTVYLRDLPSMREMGVNCASMAGRRRRTTGNSSTLPGMAATGQSTSSSAAGWTRTRTGRPPSP